MHIHKWGQWSNPYPVTCASVLGVSTWGEDWQEKICTKCNRRKIKRVKPRWD